MLTIDPDLSDEEFDATLDVLTELLDEHGGDLDRARMRDARELLRSLRDREET